MYNGRQSIKFDFSILSLNKVSTEQALSLEMVATPEEVKKAVWYYDPTKAPGYDGFNFAFIKQMWSFMGREVISFVRQFMITKKLPNKTNTTWVTLIPKKPDAREIIAFRPISTAGCVYKVVSKILSKRLRGVLSSLISKAQSHS